MALQLVALPAIITKASGLLFVLMGVAGFKLILKLCAFFGLGSLTITGFDAFNDIFIQYMTSSLDGLPESVLTLLWIGKVDKAISIILSAYVTSVGLRAVDSYTRPIMVPVG